MEGHAQYIDLKDLRSVGDLKRNLLSLIFKDVIAGYKERMGEDLLASVPTRESVQDLLILENVRTAKASEKLRKTEEEVFGILAEEELIHAFERGRDAHFQEQACRFSAQYIMIQQLVNKELSKRGFKDLWVC